MAGGDQPTIAPQAELLVPIARRGGRRLRHRRGRILVQIRSREARDVRVDTPLLSLGIKGTTFEVLVEPTQDSVLVHEGDDRSRRQAKATPWISAPAKGSVQPRRPGERAQPVQHADARWPGGGGGRAAWPAPAHRLILANRRITAAPAARDAPLKRLIWPKRKGARRQRAPKPQAPTRDRRPLDELASSWARALVSRSGL